ncbi:MAG: VCBS repeat-containing protein [Ignavibacteriaceae bacterium]
MKKHIGLFLTFFILYHFSANAQPFTFVSTNIETSGREVQWGDFDNDGDLDLLISSYPISEYSSVPEGPALIYRNDGNNKFTNIKAPLDSSYHVEWIDVNNDNYLDVFLSDAKAVYLNLVLFRLFVQSK